MSWRATPFVAALSATAILQRARRAVLVLTCCLFALTVRDLALAPDWTFRPAPRGAISPLPMLGSFTDDQTLYLGFMFLLGATIQLYMDRVPMHGSLAILAGVVMAATMAGGGFYAFGLPAFGYLMLYTAIALPDRLRRVGRTRDYSYGVYIYAFPVQQVLALMGATRYGLLGYTLLSLLGTFALAVPSWHLVERPALARKDIQVPFSPSRQRPVPIDTVAEPEPEPVAGSGVLVRQSRHDSETNYSQFGESLED